MRKWICVGVLGGLLEFGIIYQVAFSGDDSPPPEALGASQTSTRTEPVKARPARITTAGGAPQGTRPGREPEPSDAPEPARTTADAGSSSAGRRPSEPPVAAPPRTRRTSPLAATLMAGASSGAAQAAATPPPAGAPAADPPPEADPTKAAAASSEAGGIQLTQILQLQSAPEEPAPAPTPVDLAALPVEDMIRQVFGREGEKAVEVARCESTLRTHAQSGQFQGLFQMGANERADYGHGPDALAQVLAAHALFLDRGWQPWTCA